MCHCGVYYRERASEILSVVFSWAQTGPRGWSHDNRTLALSDANYERLRRNSRAQSSRRAKTVDSSAITLTTDDESVKQRCSHHSCSCRDWSSGRPLTVNYALPYLQLTRHLAFRSIRILSQLEPVTAIVLRVPCFVASHGS